MKKIIFGSMMMMIASLITGCSSVYQSGQTPDDLYYTEGSPVSGNQIAKNEVQDQYQEEVITQEDDRYLRMKVANRNKWGSIDNYSYWNDMRYNYSYSPFGYSRYNASFFYDPFSSWYNSGFCSNYYTGFGSYYNGFGGMYGGFGSMYGGYGSYYSGYGNYSGWHNPIYTVITYSKPRIVNRTYTYGSNLSAYRNRTYNNSNTNTGSSNNYGNLYRTVTPKPSSQGGNSNNSYNQPIRTFSSSSNSSSGTSSSAGGASGGFKSTGSSAHTGRGGRN